MDTPLTVEEAKVRIEHYCAVQDRCQFEVERKLGEWGMIPLAIDEIIIHLITTNHLNEERYARAYVRGKFKVNGWGRKKIQAGLLSKRVSKPNVKSGLSEIDEEEYIDYLKKLGQARWRGIDGSNLFEKKGKLARFLLQRGFESEYVYSMVNQIADPNP